MAITDRDQDHRYGETIEIIIGSDTDPKSFHIHKSILTSQSSYFRTYLTSIPSGNSILLEGYDSSTFTHLIDFIYNTPVPISHNEELSTLITTYALASELQFESCMNNCLDRLRYLTQDNLLYPDNLLQLESTSLSSSSEIHRFMIDQLAYQIVCQPEAALGKGKQKDQLTEWMKDLVRDGPREMIEEIMRMQFVYAKRFKSCGFKWTNFRQFDPSTLQGCKYHVHEETKCDKVNGETQLVKFKPK